MSACEGSLAVACTQALLLGNCLLDSTVKARGIGVSEGKEEPATVFVQFEIRPLFCLTNLSNYQS